jgi:hypothetical protein
MLKFRFTGAGWVSPVLTPVAATCGIAGGLAVTDFDVEPAFPLAAAVLVLLVVWLVLGARSDRKPPKGGALGAIDHRQLAAAHGWEHRDADRDVVKRWPRHSGETDIRRRRPGDEDLVADTADPASAPPC